MRNKWFNKESQTVLDWMILQQFSQDYSSFILTLVCQNTLGPHDSRKF